MTADRAGGGRGDDVRPGRGTAGGKAILLGEHAVVYGAPAVAVPVPSLTVAVTLEPGGAWDLPDDLLADRPALERALDAQLQTAGWTAPPPALRTRASLPAACGLGSSAAFSVALARALLGALGRPVDDAAVRPLADASERTFHANPSGVDVATVLAGHPIRFRRGEPPRAQPVGGPLWLWIVDTGVRSSTAAVVADVARARDADPQRFDDAARAMTDAAERGAAALADGDAPGLAAAMDRAMHGLRAIDVSHPAVEAILAAGRRAGALGGKLSGAGRGGVVLLLAPDGAWAPSPGSCGGQVLGRIALPGA